jgi:hypothetical protein
MLYNSENPVDVQNAITKLKYFIDKKVIFELTEKRKKRSYSQNNYQHLLFSWFALQTGYTAEEVKQEIYKKIVNSNIFYEGEFGELVKIERWRSTSDLDTSETTTAINRFRDYSSQEIEIQISKTKHYL